MANSPEEQAHWRSVLKAYDGYMQYHLSANNARRKAFLSLPRESRDMLETIGYREKLEAVDEGIRRNAEFIDEMIADPVFADLLQGNDEDSADGAEYGHGHGYGHHHDHDHDHSATHGGVGTDVPKASGMNGHLQDPSRHNLDNTNSKSPSPPASQATSHSHSHANPHLHSNAQPEPHSHSHSHSHPDPSSSSRSASSPTTQADRDQAQDKIRSTLRSFVRDWSVEGEPERNATYVPCLEALERFFPRSGSRDRRDVRVLVPGCGLGRLAMEVAARGFASQANEFSAYMLLASNFVLNQTSHPNSHTIHPYLHSFSNHLSTGNHLLRAVTIPDICPADVLGGGQGGEFSLVAGDFEEIYGEDNWEAGEECGTLGVDGESGEREKVGQRGRWGAVITCFFIDCARNVLNYLKIIYALLEDDGVWINIGPLLWHFENSSSPSAKGEGSIELSLDEVKDLARAVGFEIHDEREVRTTYTGIPDGMLRHEYQAAFWTATKRKD